MFIRLLTPCVSFWLFFNNLVLNSYLNTNNTQKTVNIPQKLFSARRTGGGQRKSVTSVKKAKKKLEYMAIYIVTTFLACYTVYYISQLITNRMKEAEKVSQKLASIVLIFLI